MDTTAVDELLARMDDLQGLDRHLGVEVAEASADRVVLTLAVDSRHTQGYGIVHGGIYATLAETAASLGAVLWVLGRGGGGAVGLSNATEFLRATRGGTLTATATPLQRGRSVQLWQVVTTDDQGRLVASSSVRLFNLAAGDPRLGG